jgi:putative ABC transport system permease protein
MLSNYLAAALRNLARNRLFASINVLGLAVGFAAAMLIALFIRYELSYDRFWPQHEQIFLLSVQLALTGSEPVTYPSIPPDVAPRMRQRAPQGVQVARWIAETHVLGHAGIEANEDILWADPELFSILPLPFIAGERRSPLQTPDSAVLSESLARKYFGHAAPIGATLQLDRMHPLRVTAVFADLPLQSHLRADIFVSARANISPLRRADAEPWPPMDIGANAFTYVKIPPTVALSRIESELRALSRGYFDRAAEDSGFGLKLQISPLNTAHLDFPSLSNQPGGSRQVLYIGFVIGLLILSVAGINYVTLMTARASRRTTEIAVRKAAGAQRRDLFAQFMGESILYALLALAIALALLEWALPAFNQFLQRSITLSYARDLPFIGSLLLLAALTGMLAGIYPAWVLSSFRPASVLRGGRTSTAGGAAAVRQALVVMQFAVLIGLIVAAAVIFRQIDYALNEALRIDKNHVLLVRTACPDAFVTEVRKLTGVRAAACSESQPFTTSFSSSSALAATGHTTEVTNTAVEPGFFELYGLKPVAGRFFSTRYSADVRPKNGAGTFTGPVILNETAVRKLGFASPAAAIGQTIRKPPGRRAPQPPSEIVGVAPDFPVQSIHETIRPIVFHTDRRTFSLLSIRLSGRQVPETLAEVDRLWREIGEPRPIQRFFADDYVQDQYQSDRRQGMLIAAFALIAIFIACLGLFGLSAFTAERRTKEIGIRKAIGAGRADIMRMLLWQFSRPVLWANLLAWPLTYYWMSRWLQGFAYRTDIAPWMFLSAGGAALLIALLTVSAHVMTVARARPVSALRYE